MQDKKCNKLNLLYMLVQERQAGHISSSETVQLVRVDRSKVYQYDICTYESIKTILLILMCETTLLVITIMGVCSIPEVYSIFFVIAWSVGLSYYGYREEIYKVEVFLLTLQLAMHLSMLLLSQLTGRRIFVVCGCFIIMVICSYVEYRQRWYSSTMMFLPVYFNAGVTYGLGVGPAWYCVIVFYLGGLACCRHIPCSNDEWERKTIFNKVQQCEMIYMGALLFLIAVTVTFWSVYWVWFSILPHLVFVGVCGTVWRHREYFVEKSLQPYTFRLTDQNTMLPMITHHQITTNPQYEQVMELQECRGCGALPVYLYEECGHVCWCADCVVEHVRRKAPCRYCGKTSQYVTRIHPIKKENNRFTAKDGYQLYE